MVMAMTAVAQNLPSIDHKRFHFGFTLGINVMDFGVKNSMLPIDGTIYEAQVSTVMPGFSVGVIGDMRLGEFFNLRFIPPLHLGERTLTYRHDQNSALSNLTLKSTFITVPFYIKYSAVRINNYRPYLIAGVGGLIDLAHDQKKAVLLDYLDYFIDFGFGCTFYTEYFRFSPEIKFGLGFNNIITPWNKRTGYLNPDDQKYSDALSRLTSRIFTLTFNFE